MAYTPSLKTNTRIDVADVLRGIAIGGIVLIHFIEQLNFYKFPEASCEFMAALNKSVWDSIFFMLASKMYAIFSMLFGLSFFIQHDNQAQQGKDFRLRFVWRMVLLFCWGLFDLLFYNGDILTVYAVCGLCVIPFIRANNKVLVAATILFALQPIELFYIVKGLKKIGRKIKIIPITRPTGSFSSSLLSTTILIAQYANTGTIGTSHKKR